ncbi:MAG: anhydro-N-acetylmuramic acid kinase [Nitrospirae bacterium]|nr:anhydro-N-acetylmuramic acid kinase [Nitrospirota bacterium]
MNRLLKIFQKRSRLILGLMSGTSHDGVDAVVAQISIKGRGSEVRGLYHYHLPFSGALREKISNAFLGNTENICRLNFELGEVFAEASLRCLEKAGLKPARIDAIASHGQTIYHIPPKNKVGGSTLQIGEASVIAERTGILVVSDFRTRDMAAAGHGAPLVPLADYILFNEKGKTKSVQNIGGIANLTVVPERIEDIMAFDTGPGMSLIDEAIRLFTNGRLRFDLNGRMAERGAPVKALLDELMRHPFLRNRPPKSTGRETFGRQMAGDIIKRYSKRKNIMPEDIVSTLTMFTALSIKSAYEEFVLPRFKVSEIILSGGGCKNAFLVRLLKEHLSPIKFTYIDDYGIPYQAKEALSFAILANETLSGRAGNLPHATGARHPVILGKITL